MSDDKQKVTEQESGSEETPRNEDAAASHDASLTVSRAEYDELKAKAEERDRFFQQLQRTVADFDNYQKRVNRDRPQWETARLRRFLLDLLPAVDDLERILNAAAEDVSIEDLVEALGLVGEKVGKILADWDVEPIATTGEVFDPSLHEALRQEPAEGAEPGAVVAELRRGYTLKGNVLRASQVVVAAGAESDAVAPAPAAQNGESESE